MSSLVASGDNACPQDLGRLGLFPMTSFMGVRASLDTGGSVLFFNKKNSSGPGFTETAWRLQVHLPNQDPDLIEIKDWNRATFEDAWREFRDGHHHHPKFAMSDILRSPNGTFWIRPVTIASSRPGTMNQSAHALFDLRTRKISFLTIETEKTKKLKRDFAPESDDQTIPSFIDRLEWIDNHRVIFWTTAGEVGIYSVLSLETSLIHEFENLSDETYNLKIFSKMPYAAIIVDLYGASKIYWLDIDQKKHLGTTINAGQIPDGVDDIEFDVSDSTAYLLNRSTVVAKISLNPSRPTIESPELIPQPTQPIESLQQSLSADGRYLLNLGYIYNPEITEGGGWSASQSVDSFVAQIFDTQSRSWQPHRLLFSVSDLEREAAKNKGFFESTLIRLNSDKWLAAFATFEPSDEHVLTREEELELKAHSRLHGVRTPEGVRPDELSNLALDRGADKTYLRIYEISPEGPRLVIRTILPGRPNGLRLTPDGKFLVFERYPKITLGQEPSLGFNADLGNLTLNPLNGNDGDELGGGVENLDSPRGVFGTKWDEPYHPYNESGKFPDGTIAIFKIEAIEGRR